MAEPKILIGPERKNNDSNDNSAADQLVSERLKFVLTTIIYIIRYWVAFYCSNARFVYEWRRQRGPSPIFFSSIHLLFCLFRFHSFVCLFTYSFLLLWPKSVFERPGEGRKKLIYCVHTICFHLSRNEWDDEYFVKLLTSDTRTIHSFIQSTLREYKYQQNMKTELFFIIHLNA